ncbi:hypothetical protein K493DRAFT_302237 [Basidiobolus meristosporus CBS 931.73]|uniref:Uncharacterized protein n=1 Tax=Basidiobolus meristosporus CBS 931.73 TaxID=1314790 RepID=A0A1Y1Y973_9FUNG|nr:hypothetical protein K493DRAFT_302237 [Basidiobolus meristosporus CBS 931.73]|eukprot:ORX94114.1 hypothetical protein K493DRAFT_302237 [Basidiobolus meristosporus CBS 931.73]
MSERITPSNLVHSSIPLQVIGKGSPSKCCTVAHSFTIAESSLASTLDESGTILPPSTSMFRPILESRFDVEEPILDLNENHPITPENEYVWFCEVPPPPRCFPYHNNSVFLPNTYEVNRTLIACAKEFDLSKAMLDSSSRELLTRKIPMLNAKSKNEKQMDDTLDYQSSTQSQELNSKRKKRLRFCSFIFTSGARKGDGNHRNCYSLIQRIRGWFTTTASPCPLKRLPNNLQIDQQGQACKRRKL